MALAIAGPFAVIYFSHFNLNVMRNDKLVLIIFMIFFCVLLLIISTACTKPYLPKEPSCRKACLVSYKYTKDTVFLWQDTLWRDIVCDRWVDTIKAQKTMWWDWTNCPPPIPSRPDFRLEKLTYYFIN